MACHLFWTRLTTLCGHRKFWVAVIFAVVIAILAVALFTFMYLQLSSEAAKHQSQVKTETLKFAWILLRHGQRTPYDTFPTNQHKSFWKEGLGQLTQQGIRDQFELGQFLRDWYSELLSEEYVNGEVWARSTDVDRNLISTQYLLTGLYYPVHPSQQWKKEGPNWISLPVHTLPKIADKLLIMESYCPRYTELLEEIKSHPDMIDFENETGATKSFLETHTGMKITEVEDYGAIYDNLYVDELNGLELPKWAKTVYPETMTGLMKQYYLQPFYTKEMQRLRAGPMIGELVHQFQLKRDGRLETRRLNLYMGHDNTLAAFLVATGLYHDYLIGFSFAVMAELHQNAGRYHVEIHLRNDTRGPPYLVSIPNCTEKCPLDQFIHQLRPLITDNIVQECGDTKCSIELQGALNQLYNQV